MLKWLDEGPFSIFDEGLYADESFQVKHTEPGLLGLCKESGFSNTNECQFYITTAAPLSYMDGKNVVFGGMNSKIFLNRSLEKNTSFGENIFIGSNCIFITGIKLEKDIIIGAGSVVLDSIIDPGLYYSKKLIRNEK